jgi:hypothetical protein
MRPRIEPFATRVHVGDRVLVQLGRGHYPGTVVAQVAKDARHPERRRVTCSVTLDQRVGPGLMHTVPEEACHRPIDWHGE